jgi:hypothetical protein
VGVAEDPSMPLADLVNGSFDGYSAMSETARLLAMHVPKCSEPSCCEADRCPCDRGKQVGQHRAVRPAEPVIE